MSRRPTQEAEVTTLPTPRALMLADLARSGLTAEDAKLLGVEPLDRDKAAKYPNAHGRVGFALPYPDASGAPSEFRRVRFLGERTGFAAQTESDGDDERYSQQPGTGCRAYFPRTLTLEGGWSCVVGDTSIPIVFTEGEKKAACACKHGFAMIGLGGVDSFVKDGELLPELKGIKWKDREVFVIHDADAATKPGVRAAAAKLAAMLVMEGARPRVGFLPAGGPKGIDDLIVAQGPEALRAVMSAARPFGRGEWPLDMAAPAKMFTHTTPSGKAPLATIESVTNLAEIYGFSLSYNVISKAPIIQGRGVDTSVGAGVQHGAMDSALNRLRSTARLCRMSTDDLDSTVFGIAYGNPVNPVLDYLESLPGKVGAVSGDAAILAVGRKFHVASGEESIRDAVFRLWMIEAVAAADYAQRTPREDARPTFEYVLTLLGGQGLFKTSTLRELVPPPIRKYFGDGNALRPEDKDSIEKVTGFWITELGEIDATIGKAANASLKAFLSQSQDVYRKPYGRARNSWPRQTVFVATGNIHRSLRDITGSRRFWPLTITRVDDLDASEVERAWAEARALYLAGEQWWPTPELQRRLDAHAEAFGEEFPLGEKVIERFGELTPARKAARGSKYLSAFKIMEVLGHHPDVSKREDRDSARELGNWLGRVNKTESDEPDRRSRAGTSEWLMPEPIGGWPTSWPKLDGATPQPKPKRTRAPRGRR